MPDLPESGAADGFAPARTLRVRVELRRQLTRPSIRLVLAAMALLPCALAASVATGKLQVSVDAEFLSGIAAQSGANFVLFALFSGSQLGLTLMVAYVFGESVAREAHWSYLPVLLTIPVRRGTLLRQKAIACALVCVLGLLVFTLVSAALGLVLYGAGPLVPVSGPHIPLAEMTWRFVAMVCYIAVYLSWIGALAILLSVLADDNVVVAFGGTVTVTLLSHLFGGLPTLRSLRSFLPTRNFDAWVVFADADVDWVRLQWGVFISLLYAALFGLLAYGVFAGKDVRASY